MIKLSMIAIGLYLFAVISNFEGQLVGFFNGFVASGNSLEFVNGVYITHTETNPQALVGLCRQLGYCYLFFIMTKAVDFGLISTILSLMALIASGFVLIQLLQFKTALPISTTVEGFYVTHSIKLATEHLLIVSCVFIFQLLIVIKDIRGRYLKKANAD